LSALQDIALRLVALGMLGTVWMLAYLRACRWVDWDLLPAQQRSRVLAWQRRAPRVMVLSAGTAGLGLVLTVAAAAS
jgi:hypothetical protein